MGCALEIGWVNKERGVVSFTWLILVTILFALFQSLSHAPFPFLISYFSHAHPTSLHPPTPPLSFALSSTLLAPSTPSSATFPLQIRLICVPTIFRGCSRTAVARSVCLLEPQVLSPWHSAFSTPPSHPPFVLTPSCGISRWISLLVRIIASAWCETPHWLRGFKPQSEALFSRCRIINRQTSTRAKMFTNYSSGGTSEPASLCLGAKWAFFWLFYSTNWS